MTTYGITATGFVTPTLDDIVAELGASLRGKLGNGLNLIAPSVFSQLVGIAAAREFAVWQAAEAVYNSQYPSGSQGQSLDNVCSISSTIRLQPTYGTVTLRCNLDAGVTLPSGQIVSAGANTTQWVTTEDGTNSEDGAADVDIPARCEITGPQPAIASSLTTKVTPYSGWNSVTNPNAATPGTNIETDAALRIRRNAELAAGGSASVDAMRAALLQLEVDGERVVVQANVFENDTDDTDEDGMPPHSMECVVDTDAGNDAAVRACIWANISGGIRPYGSTHGTVTDSQGFPQEVDFSHPTEVPIYALIHLTETADYPGDAYVQSAIAAFINALALGNDVIQTQLYSTVFGVGGVTDVTRLWIGTSSPATAGDNLTIGSREKATCANSSSDVTVVST